MTAIGNAASCLRCGQPLPDGRRTHPNRKFCSARCRNAQGQADYRERQRARREEQRAAERVQLREELLEEAESIQVELAGMNTRLKELRRKLTRL